jgi:hypothetical protein
MANKIQIKRGAKANLPVLGAGEPAFTTDTKEFFIGDGSSNIEFAKQSDLDITNTKLSDLTYQTAGGTATAITLTMQTLVNGYAKTFIASANNSAAATTINGKTLYKPGTTTAPNLIAGKAYTVWYSSTGDCFFIKASAEGTADVGQVLAGYTFSNDSDTGLSGTISSKSAVTYTPTTSDQTIAANQYLSGAQTVKGDANLVTGNIRSGATIFGVAGKSSVVDTSDANASAGQILASQTAYVNGSKVTGTMANKSGSSQTFSTLNDASGNIGNVTSITDMVGSGDSAIQVKFKPAQGYYDGSTDEILRFWGITAGNVRAGQVIGYVNNTLKGTYTANATAIASQILNGQTAGVNGSMITGTMNNNASYNNAISLAYGSPTTYVRIPQGAYLQNTVSGYPEITISDSQIQSICGNIQAGNIINGVNIFGIIGTATIASLGGKRVTTGTFYHTAMTADYVDVGFLPSFVLVCGSSGVDIHNSLISNLTSAMYVDQNTSAAHGYWYNDNIAPTGTGFNFGTTASGSSDGLNNSGGTFGFIAIG